MNKQLKIEDIYECIPYYVIEDAGLPLSCVELSTGQVDFFNELNIETFPSEMSFSVMSKNDGITWAGSNLLTIFAQYRNLFSLRFHKFLMEVLRFNRLSRKYFIPSFSLFLDSIISGTKILLPTTNAISLVKI